MARHFTAAKLIALFAAAGLAASPLLGAERASAPSPLLVGAVTPIELADDSPDSDSGAEEIDEVEAELEDTELTPPVLAAPPVALEAIDESQASEANLQDSAPEPPSLTSPKSIIVEESEAPEAMPVLPLTDDETLDDLVPSETIEPESVETELVKERYPSGSVKVAREVTMDSEGNYINHGAWQMWDQQGNLIAEGNYRSGARHGKWRKWQQRIESKLFLESPYDQYQEPFLSQATFDEGDLDGAWVIYDSQNRKASELQLVDGKRHGKSIWWYPNGQKMQEIDYQDGLVDGESKLWNQAGQMVSKSTYEDGRKLATKRDTYSSGVKKSAGAFLHAQVVPQKPDDWWTATTAKFGYVGKAVKHGEWQAWHTNGQLQTRGQYDRDVPVGEFVWYHSNGQKGLEGSYKNGKQHGPWTWWHSNGQKMAHGEYDKGRAINRWMWWQADGKLSKKVDYSNPSPSYASPASDDKQAQRLWTPAQLASFK